MNNLREGWEFYKKKKSDKIWWVDSHERKGILWFSFDKKMIYNLYSDYPENMTKEEIEIFEKENPYWAKRRARREGKLYGKGKD